MTRALPLAFVAGVYPLGLAIVLRYLGEPTAMRHAFAYLAGAATVTLGAGAAILVALRVSDFPERQQRTMSAGMQTFLGVMLLLVAVWVARHRTPAGMRRPARRVAAPPREADTPDAVRSPAANEPATRRRASGARAIFFLGMVTYLPSAFYVGAIKDLADADLSRAATILALFACTLLVLHMVELPIILRLLVPRRTGAILAAYNAWMHRHGWDIVVLAAAASGIYFLASGIITLLTSK
ncbi:GAP family protein [Frankia sp. QA3]|uniref:GAP family protein n=1 Tax=Frankia sp. QA3 TaxID=710111 RepID=UPI000269C485|nr:GAP family protein [Frankia sp. QA3]EIV94326.1 Protein of unknown function (DUF2910) [Frankia sp. QA3]